jgi:hypothetical protein
MDIPAASQAISIQSTIASCLHLDNLRNLVLISADNRTLHFHFGVKNFPSAIISPNRSLLLDQQSYIIVVFQALCFLCLEG